MIENNKMGEPWSRLGLKDVPHKIEWIIPMLVILGLLTINIFILASNTLRVTNIQKELQTISAQLSDIEEKIGEKVGVKPKAP